MIYIGDIYRANPVLEGSIKIQRKIFDKSSWHLNDSWSSIQQSVVGQTID